MTQPIDQIVHVRFDGRSEELTLSRLNLQPGANDEQIKRAVTGHFDLPPRHLDHYVVVCTDQAIIVRPEAIYG
jgi:hypothetical protein